MQLQDKVKVDEDKINHHTHFNHPFMQLLFMFLGESLALPLYGLNLAHKKYASGSIHAGEDYQIAINNGYNMHINLFMFLPGALLDGGSTIFLLISVLEINIGLTQMITSIDIIVIAMI